MRFVGAALAALALAGCAQSLPTVHWAKAGASYAAFAADRDACANDARAHQQPFYLGGARYGGRPDAVDRGLFFPCMAARGWSRGAKGFAAPPGDAFPLSP